MKKRQEGFEEEGLIVDVWNRRTYAGRVCVRGGRIVSIAADESVRKDRYLLPGWVDAHVHIESSLMTPRMFGREAVRHGVVAVVTDPHEIANVCGVAGIEYMRREGARSAVKCCLTVPSCVPSCAYDESGARVTAEDVEGLLRTGRFYGLSEVMDAVGVVSGEEELKKKIASARRCGLVVDGHSPGLTGAALRKYASAGIVTDHECRTLEEAEERIGLGMKIQIREGSAARNFAALKPLIGRYPDRVMLCADDISADKLVGGGYIDRLVARAVADGYDLYDTVRAASVNAVEHYRLPVGLLREGDRADFQVVSDLKDFRVEAVYVDGERRDEGWTEPEGEETVLPENFVHDRIDERELRRGIAHAETIMEVSDGDVVTHAYRYDPAEKSENLESDAEADIVKIVYANRYRNGAPRVSWVKGTGIREGAFATSVSHDAHNLIAFGSNDRDIAAALNAVIEKKGGRAFAVHGEVEVLPLPVGGLMSRLGAEELHEECRRMRERFSRYPLALSMPFMTLSFLALLVVPEVKIGGGGLFSYAKWGWTGEEESASGERTEGRKK